MIDQIIQASLVKDREDIVYCLGPFARRVSFSAQQNRALNLVWALAQRGLVKPGDQTAVVGAGVAGLTAAAGLIGHGCSVDVFDSNSETVARQRFTDHRLVHPTVNQWPEHELSLTTRLPFLEWSAGLCSTVTKSLASQFEYLKGSNRIVLDREVVALSDIATGVVRLQVRPRLADSRAYRLVIVAIGFGEERTAPDFAPTDYWWPDQLEHLIVSNTVHDFLVSGCGDGGLIDALRVVHQKFDKGQLAYDVAAALSGTPLAKAIAAGELSARAANDPAQLHGVYTAAVQALLADNAYEAIVERLAGSLAGGKTVYLLDRDLEQPFSLNAAPIHKLLVAHARELGKIMFRRGTASLVGTEVEFCGIRIPAPPASKVIVRHGPVFKFGRILSDDEVADLKTRQERLSDSQADPIWTEPYPVPPMLRPRDLDDPEFIESRTELARRAVRSLSEDADILPLKDRLRAIYSGAIPLGAPDELFGIPVENELRTKIRGIGG
jgi:hypothetical protein